MRALITGASSGIGREIAIYLDSLGYETILVARDKVALEDLQVKLQNKSKVILLDLSNLMNIKSLYVLVKNYDIDVLINCAGFGVYGPFLQTEVSTDMQMLEVNVRCVHILTKMFLKDMQKKDFGYILNVSSSASFMPGGPLMASYYASKAYVTSLTETIYYELRKSKSNVRISCFCPGPVDTNFNRVAGVSFSVKPISASIAAKYAVDGMFKGKMLIIPGFGMKCSKFFSRFFSDLFLMRIVYRIQKKKKRKVL